MGLFSGGGSESGNLFAYDLKNASDDMARYARKHFSPIVRPGTDGFMPYQKAGLNTFATNLFSKTSGDMATRGFLSPENAGAVVGSALTQATPMLFDIMNQNQFIPGQIRSQNLGDLRGAYEPMIQGGMFSKTKGPNLLGQAVSGWASPQGWGSFLSGASSFMGGGKGKTGAVA